LAPPVAKAQVSGGADVHSRVGARRAWRSKGQQFLENFVQFLREKRHPVG